MNQTPSKTFLQYYGCMSKRANPSSPLPDITLIFEAKKSIASTFVITKTA